MDPAFVAAYTLFMYNTFVSVYTCTLDTSTEGEFRISFLRPTIARRHRLSSVSWDIMIHSFIKFYVLCQIQHG